MTSNMWASRIEICNNLFAINFCESVIRKLKADTPYIAVTVLGHLY